MSIHPTAVVSPKAEIGSEVEIGPYATIGYDVKLGPGNVIHQHVTITGHTSIGSGNAIFPGTIIGTQPQDLKFHGEVSYLEIGDNNTFREYVTVNLGTEAGGRVTRIGSSNLIMAYCHIAHDCLLEDHTILANVATLGGHVTVEQGAVFGGMVGVHHFVTIGQYAFLGGMSRVNQDVPPFMLVEGNPARVRGVNQVGLKRNGISEDRIEAILQAYRKLYKSECPMASAMKEIESADYCTKDVKTLIQFIRASEKGKYGRALESERSG